VLLAAAGSGDVRAEQLARHRNLGKAFFENPTTKKEAVEELRKALELAPDSARDRLNYALALLSAGQVSEGIAELEKVQKQDPSLPHTWFNLGVQYKRMGEFDRAIQQLEQMVKLVPDEPASHYNLGVLYKMAGRNEEAIRKFELAARLDPTMAAPHFQLFNAYRQAGDKEKATYHLEQFRKIKEQQKSAVIPEDVEWSYYAELYDPIDPAADAGGPLAEPRFETRPLPAKLDPATAGALAFDADGDARPDLLVWSASGVALYLEGTKAAPGSGLAALKDVVAAAAGDFDNDGLADLCLVTKSAVLLLRNAKGRFEKAPLTAPPGPYEKAVWLDYDHDNDVDLLLLGARSVLLRNQGAAGFAERTADFPFVRGHALDAIVFRAVPDTKSHDLVVTYADRNAVLYRDRLGGLFEATPLPDIAAGARGLAAADADNNGWIDLVFQTGPEVVVRLAREGRSSLVRLKAAGRPALADLDNRGRLDLVAGGSLFRNHGQGRFEAVQPPAGFPDAVAWCAADFDSDGRVDLVAAGRDGRASLLRNLTVTKNNWLRVALTGVRAPRLAAGAEVEVRSATRYQKRVYEGLPLLFGLRSDQAVDMVRISWPNGLIQTETKQPANRTHTYKEQERLTGSCPMVWTWNGREFQFLTDVLGVAPLGAKAGDGTYFPTDHDEYVQIPGEALAPRDGHYEIRITEELSEVSYIDQVKLIAVDHPAGVDIFTNEKFQGPPFPEFRLFGVRERLRPVAARDHRGRDVLALVAARDRRYPDAFRRTPSGVAEMHSLELDFGAAAPANDAVLVLHGWVDWASGSTFLGRAQEGDGGLILPYLQVKDREGRWRTVIEDMGLPAGKPKTIVVDLRGKFLSPSRAVRIVTNVCVYWDEAFLATGAADPPVRLRQAALRAAELGFRGFSRVRIHPERKQPEMFFYPEPRPVAMWNPTPGLYTRYGGVGELVGDVDDRFVIMGSGDELRLRFDAALPPPERGWKRDFLLLVDGWAKDSDPNTAFSQTVEPLPFHAMSSYPYPAAERYPDGERHREYKEKYNTRPALRLLRPLRLGDRHEALGAESLGGGTVRASVN
jgi:tetratricopeptide (TPR) repeat protein